VAASLLGAEVITPRVGEVFEAGKPFQSQAWYRPGR
jgi:hypothetical protein